MQKHGRSRTVAGALILSVIARYCSMGGLTLRLLQISLPVMLASSVTAQIASGHTNAAAIQIGEYTPSNCPPISDRAVIVAKIVAADSGAPDTEHPGVDLWIRDGAVTNVLRIHFGDRGDHTNSCLPYDDCKNMEELPISCPVKIWPVKSLIAYLKQRDYRVGKFISWGIPVLPWGAHGSNCGDAFVATVSRLGIADDVLPPMRQWAKKYHKGQWAFDRGRRRPEDDFFAGINCDGEDLHLAFRGPPPH